MGGMITIEVEGLKEILDTLERAGELQRLMGPTFKTMGDSIVNEAGKYPAALPAPAMGTWWKRGEGQRYYRKDGGFTRTGNRSEQLGKQWNVIPGDRRVTIENLASYAALVHGEQQTGVHAGHGWKRLDVTARAIMPRLMEALRAQVRRILGNR